MIVTRKHVARRTFLKGMGAVVALPVLDAMTPAFAQAAAGASSPLRLAFTYVPNGVVMAQWTPKGEGLGFEYSRVLKPLERFREHTVVLSGLAHKNGYALGDGPGDHARAAASYLTGVHPRKTAGADIQNGISIDQIAAQHLAPQTRFASIELGCDDSRTVGNCDSAIRVPTLTAWGCAGRRPRCRRNRTRASRSSASSVRRTPAFARRRKHAA